MSATPDDMRAKLRLRPEPPRVTRLSRRILIGLGGVASLVIGGALIWALNDGRSREAPATELYSTDNRSTADGLQRLPRDYTVVPTLGPALPGDLGRPILRAQEEGRPVAIPAIETPRADPGEQQRLAESEAARVAGLFTAARGERADGEQSAAGMIGGFAGLPGTTAASGQPGSLPLDPGAAQNMQDRKTAFLEGETDRRIVSGERLQGPASPYILQAGSVIPAALLTGIRSDLPGLVTAQVTENVHDSLTGSHLLIPQGSRLIGQYDSQIAFGQSRLLLVWTRLILPDGSSTVLERLAGADASGQAGLEDGVDYHRGRLFGAAALSTLLGVATELSSDDESDVARAIRESAQGTVADIGGQIVSRQMNVQPTLTIRPGFPLRVLVGRDLVLRPYGETQ